MTIQRSSESRAFSTTSEETDVEKEKGKFTCYICNVACANQKVRHNCVEMRQGVSHIMIYSMFTNFNMLRPMTCVV